jgi:4-hydroxy-L-threonine phosphate dehydrogenase PdxA|tara:strand:+ start:1900 stop:2892 length:993 start_codon:yes stop_codon:yes gene_type:complete
LNQLNPKIALPIGDPSGIGPEIVLKTLADKSPNTAQANCTLIGDWIALEAHARAAKIDLKRLSSSHIMITGSIYEYVEPSTKLNESFIIGNTTPDCGRACFQYAEIAISGAIAGKFEGIAAAPHTELSINQAGIKFSGYPNLLASMIGGEHPISLLMIGGHLAVIHVTLHQSLASAIKAITIDRVLQTIRTAFQFFKTLENDPKIAVCGLNPHAGEDGLFGNEDIDLILPAIQRACSENMNVLGPVSPDSTFHRTDLDCIVAMYHDQGHIPVKTIAPRSSIALSIGSNILFGTVAHGSALDISGQGQADHSAFDRLLTEIITKSHLNSHQ